MQPCPGFCRYYQSPPDRTHIRAPQRLRPLVVIQATLQGDCVFERDAAAIRRMVVRLGDLHVRERILLVARVQADCHGGARRE